MIAYESCYLYLGHNSVALLYNSPDDFFFIEEEKEIRQKAGEYVPLKTLLMLRRYTIGTLYLVNFLGDIDFSRILDLYFSGDTEKIAGFLARTRLLEIDLSHHLTHAVSALFNLRNHLDETPGFKGGRFHLIVSDGTGTDYESITLYELDVRPEDSLREMVGSLRVLGKTVGGYLSCGLAFARLVCNRDTGFAVLKDEHKSAGYETHINGLLSRREIETMDRVIRRVAKSFLEDSNNPVKRSFLQDIAAMLGEAASAFPADVDQNRDFERSLRPIAVTNGHVTSRGGRLFKLHRERWLALKDGVSTQHFQHGFSMKLFQRMSATVVPALAFMQHLQSGLSRHQVRVLSSYVAGKFLESYYDLLVERHCIENLIVSGGVHYNVKLNNFLLRRVPGYFSATPLAGDVAHVPACAALHRPELALRLKSLRCLARDLRPPAFMRTNENVIYTEDPGELVAEVGRLVAEGAIVNVIKGRGELGPRALLNSSTLALPSRENRLRINLMNHRDDYMPMAPSLTEDHLGYFFHPEEYERVIGSLEYMIVSLRYRSTVDRQMYDGVMHYDPSTHAYTGRPQVVRRSDEVNYHLLKTIEERSGYRAVINTSFNIHGKSTVQRVWHAWSDFRFQRCQSQRAGIPDPYLVIGNFDD